MGRIRVTLANVDRYKGQFKQALAFSKASLGFEPVNDRLRWVSVKILAEERLPDVIGSIVTVDGRDLGREMVETGLMVRFDPTRTAPPIPKVPLVTGVYAHEKEEEAAVEEPKAQAHPEEKEWGGERRPRRYRKVRDGRLKE
jgi:endonuclease YncB( thermonuclease family)